jgi:hypothetical protein
MQKNIVQDLRLKHEEKSIRKLIRFLFDKYLLKLDMKKGKNIIILLSAIISVIVISGFVIMYPNIQNSNYDVNFTSPYTGEETRGIKSLSQDDINGLQNGAGTPFGGMAKLAELNGYPGPKHVLDLTSQLELNDTQIEQIDKIYQNMKFEAVILGEKIITVESQLNEKFSDGSINENYLQEKVHESAEYYAELRNVHLQSHLLMMTVLSSDQVQKYGELRGYSLEDPCEHIPEGHDAKMWKLHNNC